MSTEILALDEITASQSAKEVTHNTGLRQLEGRMVRVKSRTTAAEPASPAAGDTYILPASPTGTNWATFTAKQIVHYYGGSWKAWTPIEGVCLWVNDLDQLWAYNGTDWVLAVPAGGDVVGPASATDNALVKFDGTTGKLVKNTAWLLDNSNVLNAQDAVLQRPEMKDYSETVASPAISAGTLPLDVTTANVFDVTLNENVTTLDLSNPSPTGKACSITLFLKQDATGGRTFAWPASVKSPGGSLPSVTSAANAQDIYSLVTKDAGATWYVFTGGQGFA